MSETFDPYYKWLGIPPDEQPPHHYRLLAVRLFEPDADVIEAAAEQRMAHVRNYQAGPYGSQSQQILNELATARICLLNAEQRARYDQALRTRLAGKAPPALPVRPPGLSERTVVATPVAAPPQEETTAVPLDFLRERAPRPGVKRHRRDQSRSSAALLLSLSAMVLAAIALAFFIQAALSRKHVSVPTEPTATTNDTASNSSNGKVARSANAPPNTEDMPEFPKITPHPVTLPDPPPREPNVFLDWMQKLQREAEREAQRRRRPPVESGRPATNPSTTTPGKPAPPASKPDSQPEPESSERDAAPKKPVRQRRTLAEWVTESIERRTLERSLAAGGGDGGTVFTEVPPSGALLTGFHVTLSATGDITSIQPVFVGIQGTRGGPGGRYGTQRGRQVNIVARHGYAVAALRIQGEKAVEGFEVDFARITSTGLDREDLYKSPWVGRRTSDPGIALGGDGMPVVGIYGRAGVAVYSLGLIQLPAE